ncbi:Acyl-CoA-binding domain-containing protein 4 [Tupaia chinensis]|uniref:Acyl-CoA-binding domain-containing protein 4 n=1 Tax=Tupaia chinensis TaxID=246437 RepID=L8Y556_TUPCH|nr:Acyl-CoA-binding domain-containing protein 4 [Tupaia chinensis]
MMEGNGTGHDHCSDCENEEDNSYNRGWAEVRERPRLGVSQLMENKTFLEKLKFGIGDGNLQYYLYNWKCPSMGAEKSRSQVGPQAWSDMGTESESPEPDCQKQFQAAVSVIQNLPKNDKPLYGLSWGLLCLLPLPRCPEWHPLIISAPSKGRPPLTSLLMGVGLMLRPPLPIPSPGSYRPSYEEMLRFYSYYKQATMGPCLVPRPGFWDPIGRYKWEAWNSLGKMSREEAMSAYITEMKLVAQKVIDTVPLGEVAEDMFGYFEPLYQVIPDMPRPPEAFLRRVTVPTSHPPFPPLSPACSSSHPQTYDSSQQVWAEQRESPAEDPDTRNSPTSPTEKGRLEGSLLGPQELDMWLVGTVRALQESMRDVQGRLQSLESLPQPPTQVSLPFPT